MKEWMDEGGVHSVFKRILCFSNRFISKSWWRTPDSTEIAKHSPPPKTKHNSVSIAFHIYIYMDIYIIYIRIDILQKVRFTSYKQSLILELQRVFFFSAMLSELQEFRNDKFFSIFLYVTKYYVQGHDLKMTLFSWLQ